MRSEKDQYSYNPGYGHFLSSNLQALNKQKPGNAHDLLTSAANLMFAPKEPLGDSIWSLTDIPQRDPKPLKECLPKVFAAVVNESTIISPLPSNPAFGGIANPMFGPVSDLEYGFPTSSFLKIAQEKGKDLGLVTLDFQVKKYDRQELINLNYASKSELIFVSSVGAMFCVKAGPNEPRRYGLVQEHRIRLEDKVLQNFNIEGLSVLFQGQESGPDRITGLCFLNSLAMGKELPLLLNHPLKKSLPKDKKEYFSSEEDSRVQEKKENDF